MAVCLVRSGAPNPDAVSAMLAAAPHRGRRSQQLVHGTCALGVSFDDDLGGRLDLAEGVAVVLAGTIDNLGDLEAELAATGNGPVPTTPAGILGAYFELQREQTPARLRGVFAAVLCDGTHLYCFRDQLGFANLVYRDDGRHVFVASEGKQVVAGAGIPKEPDVDVLERIFFGSVDSTTPTALRGVERLPKATLLRADAGGVHMRRYWDPEPLLETARYSGDELAERFGALMTQAAARCVTGTGDVVSLSGGIDSPAVAAFAAPRHLELAGGPLRALSAVFPEHPSVDERPYIELVADRLGLELHTFAQHVNALDQLQKWAELTDGPMPAGSLPHYADSYRRVRSLDGHTLLTGEFAEFVVELDSYLLHHLLTHGRLGPFRRRLRGSRRRRALTAGRIAVSSLEPAWLTAARWRRRGDGTPEWVDRRRANEAAAASAVRSWRRWRAIQLEPLTGVGVGLEAEEICQAVCGVRSRRPWADVDLWELFLSLPAEVKLPGGGSKSLVRRLLRGRVPDEILDRRDKTFFDRAMEVSFDYATLRRWLVAPPHRLEGVDYRALAGRLELENLTLSDYLWASRLAGVHAFLSLW